MYWSMMCSLYCSPQPSLTIAVLYQDLQHIARVAIDGHGSTQDENISSLDRTKIDLLLSHANH